MAQKHAAQKFRCELDQITVKKINYFVYRTAKYGHKTIYHCEIDEHQPHCLTENASAQH